MSKFIEVDIANTDSKTLVNVDQIVNVGKYKSDNTGCINFRCFINLIDIVFG